MQGGCMVGVYSGGGMQGSPPAYYPMTVPHMPLSARPTSFPLHTLCLQVPPLQSLSCTITPAISSQQRAPQTPNCYRGKPGKKKSVGTTLPTQIICQARTSNHRDNRPPAALNVKFVMERNARPKTWVHVKECCGCHLTVQTNPW